MKEMSLELNEAIRRSRGVGRGSARSTRPNYMRIPALGLEPPTETAGEDAAAEDVEVSIAPGFSAADLESAEASKPGQMTGNINEAGVVTKVAESAPEEPVLPHKEPVNGEGGGGSPGWDGDQHPKGFTGLGPEPRTCKGWRWGR